MIVRNTRPMRPCWTKALTRKRPMPEGAMAKLHSLVASELGSPLVGHDRTRDFAGVDRRRLVCDTGVILPSIFIAGGNPAVMNKSDPLGQHRSNNSWTNFSACSRSMMTFRAPRCRASELPVS